MSVNVKVLTVLVVFSCIFAIVLALRQTYNGEDCPSGSPKHYLIDCNLCKCDRGHIINCTHYICTEDGIIATGQEKNCVEREIKYDSCIFCRCVRDTWLCTTPQCNTTHPHIHKRSIPESFCIFNGMKKQIDCGECVCRDNKWECSENACVAQDRAVRYISFFEEDLKEVSCSPFDILAIECSLCQCNANSVGYSCTTVENCNEDVDEEVKIKSGKFYIDMFGRK